MRRLAIITFALWPGLALADCVILLHGLARSESSFYVMEQALKAQGHEVVRPGYPSTSADIETLANAVLPGAFASCGDASVHVVSHSMGGILLRTYLRDGVPETLKHVVMLGPPNQGSELVDELGDLAVFGWLHGPAGHQLGTNEESYVRNLPAVDFSLGVIAGTRSLNPYFSSLLPGPDDGKVSVATTKVDGMRAHLSMPVTHTFMMVNPRVIAQVAHFLKTGAFVADLTWADLQDILGDDDARP